MSLKLGLREDIPSVINRLRGTYKNNNKVYRKNHKA